MKKEIFAISIILLLSHAIFSGCIEDSSQVDDQHPVEKPKIVYIDDDYDNTISRWGYDHFDSIQDGVNKVSDNGTVYVSDGIYYENILINKTINLIGNNKDTTIIDGGEKEEVIRIANDNCTIQNINISNSGFDAGVKIISNGNTLTDNVIYGNFYGIWIESQFYNVISNNIIINNKYGIKLKGSFYTNITENQILKNSQESITLDSSHNTTVLDNNIQSNGIKISGSFNSLKSHLIKNNTVNNKYIYYYKNENGVTVPNDAAQVILANCSNFEIKNIKFENIMIGIQISYSSNIRIDSNSFISNNESALLLYLSNNITIIGNTINGGEGIKFSDSENNDIMQNTITNTETSIELSESNYNDILSNEIFSNSKYGIYLRSDSNYNQLSKNKIYDNDVGFRLSTKYNSIFRNEFNNNSKGFYICCAAENNVIYKNSFINNKKHVDYTIARENLFFKDSFGNYWDDYLEKYPDAIQINGIWDTSYKIVGNIEDKYPLVEPIDI